MIYFMVDPDSLIVYFVNDHTQWNLSLHGWHLKGKEKGIPGVVEASPPPVSLSIVQSHAQIPFLFPFERLP